MKNSDQNLKTKKQIYQIHIMGDGHFDVFKMKNAEPIVSRRGGVDFVENVIRSKFLSEIGIDNLFEIDKNVCNYSA